MSVSLFSTVGFEPVTLKGSVFSVLFCVVGVGGDGIRAAFVPPHF